MWQKMCAINRMEKFQDKQLYRGMFFVVDFVRSAVLLFMATALFIAKSFWLLRLVACGGDIS